jgi:hypothetical protein
MFAARPSALNTATAFAAVVTARASCTKIITIKG